MHKRRLAFGTASFSGMLFWNEASKNSKSISYLNITNSTSHTPEIDILSKYHESNQSHTSSLYSNSGSLYVWVNFWNINFGWVISVQRNARVIESPKLQIIFHKRATKHRSPLRKMTYKDKGSYESPPPCTKERKSHQMINPDEIIEMSRTQSITRGNITKVCDALAFLHSDESSSSWRVNESELLHSWHVNEGFVIWPHHPAEAAADFLNELCFGVVFLKESSKFHELNRSSICHELSESNFITSRT